MDLFLNKKLYTETVEMIPIRKGYGLGLLEAGEKNENVVTLCADLTDSTQTHLFKQKFPERFIEMGVCEQSMASVASGMAAMGKIPFINSYAMFSPGRNWEQIRTTICYNNVNVKVIGSHAGVSVGPDGGTHQALEDIAITRVIPRMDVIVPCDSIQAKKATLSISNSKNPSYLRLQRESTPIITTDDTPFEIGKAYKYFSTPNPKITVFACGGVLYNALLVAKTLEREGINISVINVPTIKPLDEEIVKYAKESEKVVTIEEHQIAGGLGSAISELLSEKSPMPVYRIGVNDRFGQSGKPEELINEYGLSVEKIKNKIKSLI